jgi:iron complex outermembrane receptor protein
MNRFCPLLIALLFVCSLHAQETLRGKVIDADDSSGVAFAVIYLPDVNKSAIADSNGVFEIGGVPGASQKIIISRIGYTTLASVINCLTYRSDFVLKKSNAQLQPVVVLGTQTQVKNESVSSTTVLQQREMRKRGALSISDGVARLPGVTQLNTGIGISKPVIRGLYGNRIQTIMLGMRFDNQQWQDEHGLGLQDIGVDRVEVIKGPMSLVYGSEAMGGVINIIEESPATVDSVSGDVSMRLFSNTFGAALDAGVKVSKDKYFWRVRAGSESHADYSDGNNKRIQNSRFDGHVAKGTFGFNTKNWSCANNYLFSKSDFGFIMDTSSYLAPDGRLGRSFENPHHTVFINMFTSQNSFFMERAIVRFNIGGHINRRMEDEGGGGISLDMRLITASMHFQIERYFNSKWTMLTGIQSQYQDNTNFGWRKIVPDATMAEASGYCYFKYVAPHAPELRTFVFEGGIRYDFRHITTFETGTLNSGQFALPAISKNYTAINGSAGVTIPFLKILALRINGTTGYRSPNLAELSSSGVHEGTLRFEVGNVNMNIEQNICGEAALELEKNGLSVSVAGYYNQFFNYIYLVPTAEEWFGFRVYRFVQTDAALKGMEATFSYTPRKEWITLDANYSMVRAQTTEGNYLPFIPADKISFSATRNFGDYAKLKGMYARAGTQYYFDQHRAAQFETPTDQYILVDVGIGTSIHTKKNNMWDVDVACNNLFNEVYYDHLSRFKEFNIYNIGRNITLNLKYQW